MRKWLMGLLLGMIVLSVQAKEIKRVTLPETVTVDQVPLVLNGAGIRTKLLFDVYVIGLYTPQKMQQPEAIIHHNKPRRILITLLRTVDANSMYVSLLDGLKHNLSTSEISSFQAQIAQMEALFRRSGALQKGDSIILDFIPTRGLKINIRGGQHTANIVSEAFARSVLKIWLGQKPADKKLKHLLAGGTEA
jgi:hypothetical protein